MESSSPSATSGHHRTSLLAKAGEYFKTLVLWAVLVGLGWATLRLVDDYGKAIGLGAGLVGCLVLGGLYSLFEDFGWKPVLLLLVVALAGAGGVAIVVAGGFGELQRPVYGWEIVVGTVVAFMWWTNKTRRMEERLEEIERRLDGLEEYRDATDDEVSTSLGDRAYHL